MHSSAAGALRATRYRHVFDAVMSGALGFRSCRASERIVSTCSGLLSDACLTRSAFGHMWTRWVGGTTGTVSSTHQNAQLTAEVDTAAPPVEPGPEDCCVCAQQQRLGVSVAEVTYRPLTPNNSSCSFILQNSGCQNCVWTQYHEARDAYEAKKSSSAAERAAQVGPDANTQ